MRHSRFRARSHRHLRSSSLVVATSWLLTACYPLAHPPEKSNAPASPEPASRSAAESRSSADAGRGAPPAPPDDQASLERARARRKAWKEPKDLEDALRRLQDVRQKLAQDGKVRLRYREPELRALVSQASPPQDRYLVRLLFKSVSDGDKLGFPRSFGKLPIWVTTFEQLEPADSDPEVICRMLGIAYDPKATYYLLVLRDLGADLEKRPEVVIPTRDTMLTLAKRELCDGVFQPADFDAAMAPGYQPTYRALMADLYARHLREYIPDDLDRFVDQTESLRTDPKAQKQFRARVRMQVQLGVTDLFRGDGLTELVGPQARKVGVQEVFVLDSQPQNIGEYSSKGQLAKVQCLPLEKAQPLTFVEPDDVP